MIKRLKSISIIFCFILINFIIFMPTKVEAKSLRDIYSELNELQAEIDANKSQQQATSGEISSANSEINSIAKEITTAQDNISKAKQEIINLSIKIEETREETEEILRYFQISSGETEYLEYIFGAENLTDFIHRNAVVEKLSEYNETMIYNMNESIEEQERLQVELAKKQVELTKKQSNLRSTRARLYGVQTTLSEEHLTLQEEIDVTREMIELYESLGTCGLDDDINVCARNVIPPDTRFWRSTDSGRVSSEWGYRNHPTYGTWRMHNGIDIGGGYTGKPIYSSAAGKVSYIKYVPSNAAPRSYCGGQYIFINHKIYGKSYTTAYLHVNTINVKVGDIVTKNTVIAGMGGGEAYDRCTTGPHLHFSLMNGITGSLSGSINPRDFINFPSFRVWFDDRITRY